MFKIPGMLFSCAYRGFIIYADNEKSPCLSDFFQEELSI